MTTDIEETKEFDKFRSLRQYGNTYDAPRHVPELLHFALKLDRNYGLVVIKLGPPKDIYLHEHTRLWMRLRELKTFCTDSVNDGLGVSAHSIWVVRGVMTREARQIKDLGLTLIHHSKYEITLASGDGAQIGSYQDVVNGLENLVDNYGKRGVHTEEQMSGLITEFIGGPERTISVKTTTNTDEATADTAEATAETTAETKSTIELDLTFWDKVKPEPLGNDISLTGDRLDNMITVGDFVPARQRVGLYCGRDNVGKTAWLIQLAAWLTATGLRVLYITTDQDAEDLTPYAVGLGCNRETFHVHSAKNNLFDADHLEGLINAFAEKFGGNPDLLILDSLADIVIEAADRFVGCDSKGRPLTFNEYRAADWKMAFSGFINPLAVKYNMAILGSLHSTPKGELNEHAVPLSHRLPGLVEFCFMVFDKDVNPKGAWNKRLISTLRGLATDTRLLFCRRTRSGSKRRSYFYDLGNEITKQRVGRLDCVRSIVNVREAVSEAPKLPTDRPAGKEIFTVFDILDRIVKLAGGQGKEHKIAESKVLRALRCDPTHSDQAEDAEYRREVYTLAKASDWMGLAPNAYRGCSIWVTEDYGKPDESTAHMTRGHQDE